MLKRIISAALLAMLFIVILVLLFNVQSVKASGTIYIRADGSVEPSTAPISSVDNITYTFTNNINDSIVVERSNIIIDGNGYTLQGNGSGYGFSLFFIDNVTIKNANIKNFSIGIWLDTSFNSTVIENSVTGNNWGIFLYWDSQNNTVSGNNIKNNKAGIVLSQSSNNSIFHNNFINNTNQTKLSNSFNNTWDDGYPSGGNYWSDYTGVDLFSGPYQNTTGSDGIGDTPYIIDANNRDNYPLIHPYGSVRNLNTNLTYLSVQSAIDASETLDGHTIFVRSGVYCEHVVVNKAVSLVGESRDSTFIEGNGTGTVLSVTANNVNISHFTVQGGGSYGMYFRYSSYNRVMGNRIINNGYGLCLEASNGNTISDNEISSNKYGIWLSYSEGNQLANNNLSNNTYNFGLSIDYLSQAIQNIDTSNTVNGKPIYYLINQKDLIVDSTTFPSVGYLGLINSTNVLVRDLNITNNGQGILFAFTNNSKIEEADVSNNFMGIFLVSSNNNTIADNTLVNNFEGICLWGSTDQNTILKNDIRNHLTYPSDTPKGFGIYHSGGHNNTIINNYILNHSYGIYLNESSNNSIYHNNLMSNDKQAFLSESHNNLWDDGYPSGGNYWSDYTGTDYYQGSYQNQTGSDGIGDFPYEIDVQNQDNYPLVNPWAPPDIAVMNVIPSKAIVIHGFTLDINVTIANQGNKIEGFDVIVYANNTIIASETVMLLSGNTTTVISTWNTTDVAIGNYTIKAYVTPLPGETDTPDNTYINGIVTVRLPISDVAVVNVTPFKTVVGTGFNMRINVTVGNQGDYPETFTVMAYANTTVIGTLADVTLASGNSTTLTFTWDTTVFARGYYTVSANVTPVLGETDIDDNSLTYGQVRVVTPGNVNGDEIVNMLDIYAELVLRFMAETGDLEYSANSDINCDGIINMQDIYTAILHFMEREP